MGRWVRRTSALKSVCIVSAALTTVPSIAAPRPPADAAAYRLVFADDFNGSGTTALDAITNPRAKWFRTRFFGEGVTPPSMLSFRNGVLTLKGTAQRAAHIQTASPVNDDKEGWGGRVFRHGGYFEARIAVGADALATTSSWPSFWGMAIEHMPLRGRAQWVGQPSGYMRFIENDFFEYNPRWSSVAYFATLWEWYGRWELCSKGRWCDLSTTNDPKRAVVLPSGRKFSSFNIYGQKWVPARGRQRGYVQNYLNGRPVGPKTSWRAGAATPPTSDDLRFNIMDHQGLMLVLATGGQPMHVDWVRVWQAQHGRVEQRR